MKVPGVVHQHAAHAAGDVLLCLPHTGQDEHPVGLQSPLLQGQALVQALTLLQKDPT